MKKIVICILGIIVPLSLVFMFFIYSKTNQIEMYTKRVEDVKVSVIIPVYNVENYLRACLKSVQNQTLEEFEGFESITSKIPEFQQQEIAALSWQGANI